MRTSSPLVRATRDTLYCAAIVAVALVAGIAAQLLLPGDRVSVLAVTAGSALAPLLLVAFGRRNRLRDAMASFRFAGTILAVLSVAVIVGTLVPQEKPAQLYLERYGGAADVLIATGVTTLFHSSWFGALVGVMAAGLIVSSVRRWPPSLINIGFFAIHAGLLLVLGGSALSSTMAVRGRVDLRVGAPPAREVAVTQGGVRTGATADLGFALRLDSFKVDKYDGEHRLAVYEIDLAGEARRLAVFEHDEGLVHRLPDGARFRVKSYQGDDAAAAGHFIGENDGTPIPVEPGGELVLSDGARLRVIAFYPSFTFDRATRTPRSLGEVADNPALEVEIAAPGAAPRRQILLMSSPGQASGGGRPGLAYSYRPRPAADDAAVIIEFTDERGTQEARLQASRPTAIFFGARKALTFERRPDEARAYRSGVSVLGDGPERRMSVAVNAPISVNGWTLYQVNFDPRDPSYSGLEAVRDPGVPWVFAGFALMALGVPYMVNVAPWLRRRQAQPRTPETPTTKGERS